MDSTWREADTTTLGERLFPVEEAFPDQLKLFRYRMQLASGSALILICATFAIDVLLPPQHTTPVWIARAVALLTQLGFFLAFRVESIRMPRLVTLVYANYLVLSLCFAAILLIGRQAPLFTIFHALATSMLLLPVSNTQASAIQGIVLAVVAALGVPVIRDNTMGPKPFLAGVIMFAALVVIVRSAAGMTFALRLSEAKTRDSIEEAMRKLNFLSSFDHLTRVANRSNFESVTEAAVMDARSMKESLAYLEVDLDFFKKINDDLGHQAGDAVLRAASERIAGCLRTGDQVGRMGGDEFAVLIRGATMEIATSVADRILQSFQATNLKTSWGEIALSCTIGVAWYPGWGGLSSNSLMAAADESLYEAKEAGRGRVGSVRSPQDIEARMSTEVMAPQYSVETSAVPPGVPNATAESAVRPAATDDGRAEPSVNPQPEITAPLSPPPHAR